MRTAIEQKRGLLSWGGGCLLFCLAEEAPCRRERMMIEMVHALRIIFNIGASSGANWVIYFIKRLPVLRKKIGDNIYADISMKKIFAVIAVALKMLWRLLKKFSYVGLLLFMPVVFGQALTETGRFDAFVHIFVLISFFVAAFSSCTVMETSRDKFVCVRLMRFPAWQYMRATMAMKSLMLFVYFALPLGVFSALSRGAFLAGVQLALLAALFRVGAEAFHLWIYDKTGVILAKKFLVVGPVVLLGYAGAYLPVFLNPGLLLPARAVLSLPAFAALLLLAFAGGRYLWRYPRYHAAVLAATRADDPVLNPQKIGAAKFADVKMRAGDFSGSSLTGGIYADKKGYDYLNAIFFQRHRRLLVRPVILRVAIVGFLFLAGLIFALLLPAPASQFFARVTQSLPMFVFIMYFTSIGERICRAMFYNCDISLLRYGFYRKKEVILKNFRIRLLRVCALNLIPAAAICVSLAVLAPVAGASWSLGSLLVFLSTILCLSLFFSVHHLFAYYIFQPYTTELQMKNPFFTILNTVVYALCFICYQIQTAPGVFSLIVLGATLLYMAVALALVYRLSPRTFRVK